MGSRVFTAFLAAALGLVATAAQKTAPNGSTGVTGVKGTVLDENGKPVLGATIWHDNLDVVENGMIEWPVSDAKGEFLLTGILPGRNRVCASKENAGYANASRVFYDRFTPCPIVTVREGEVASGVVIKVGPKAARVFGTVYDASTGQPPSRAVVAFLDAASAKEFIATQAGRDGRFSILLPFGTPINVQASAPGYQTWSCSSDGTEAHAEPILLKSGESKELHIRLRPIKTSSP